MSCKIVCPSRKRAGKILTNVENMIICVAESEKNDYKNEKFDVITHKNLKSLAEIRQFIFKKFKNVFMVDDDIVAVQRLYTTKNQDLSPREVFDLIQNTYFRAKDTGAHLFGFNNDPTPTHYNQHKPFVFSGYINGCAIGLIESEKLYFTPKTTAAESHWINLLNAYFHRYNFIDKRFCFKQKQNSTFKLEGGQAGKRTMQSEMEDTLFLKRMFGDSVNIKTAKNKTIQLHQYQRELNIKI